MIVSGPRSVTQDLRLGNVCLAFARFAICFTVSLVAAPAANEMVSPQIKPSPGDDLFANESVLRIHVEMRPQELQSLREESRRYVRSTISAEGKVYRDVGIHLKGSTGSFRGVDDKPALTLDFSRFVNGQKFHQLRKIHLNNSVEDPSYVNEKLGSELFRAVGMPAPRVGHALVELNGRQLGLYVLKEGFTEDFLGRYFKRVDGNLYDTDWGHDVDERMKRLLGRGPDDDQRDLKAVAKAAREPGLSRRWQRLTDVLDIDRFFTFMTLEVMICHRDGYSLARNNFRIYDDPETKKMVFFPHGMDQLFGKSDLPWKPRMAGIVAQSLMETSEGRLRYETRFTTLFTNLFIVDRLTNRVNQIVASLRPYLEKQEFKAVEREAAEVRERIVRREFDLRKQLSQRDPALLDFKEGIASLAGWTKVDEPAGGNMDETTTPEGVRALRIVAGSKTSASWRTTLRLGRGHYRFEGQTRISSVTPLPFGKNQGAGLRVADKTLKAINFTGSSNWKKLAVEFQVDRVEEDVELVCELRASAGQAWFDKDSLRLAKSSSDQGDRLDHAPDP
ncbi:MAG: hypothetical protein DME22_08430 [Verrucomicrobia bacterium]|nr:MAG: hypothetical protein DME22_08430 [Verrucomicrobiota bacterium]